MADVKRVNVPLKPFLAACSQYKTAKETAEALGISEQTVQARLAKYRKVMGEDADKLPKFERKASTKLTADALSKVLAEMQD